MITVVTPCYNHGEFLEECIESVLAQTEDNFEYLLINDGSTDNTWEIMKKWEARDERIRTFDRPKAYRVGAVLNFSIRQTNHVYWVWAPADDTLHPQLLQRKYEQSLHFPNAVIYSAGIVIDGNGDVVGHRPVDCVSSKDFAALVQKESPIGFTGIWIPMHLFDDVGNFPTNCYSEDFEWMIRATLHGVEFIGIGEKLYSKRNHPNRITGRKIETILRDVPKIRSMLATYKELLDG